MHPVPIPTPPRGASLPWEPSYTPSSVRFLFINTGAVKALTVQCHNHASTMDAKTPMGRYVFSLHHVAPLTASVGLAPKALLYYHGLGPGHSTGSSLLLVGRDRGRQESFLSHLFLFLSKYRGPLPQGNEMKKKKRKKKQRKHRKQEEVFSLICHAVCIFMCFYSCVLWEEIAKQKNRNPRQGLNQTWQLKLL